MGLNWLDVAMVVFIVVMCLDGMNKGFVHSCFNIIGLFASLLAAKLMTPFAAEFLRNNTQIYNSIKAVFEKKAGSLSRASLSLLQLFDIEDAAIGEALANIFINIICFICILVIFVVVLSFFRDLIKGLIKNTPVEFLDKLGGLGIGIIKAGIWIFVFFAVITPLLGLLPQSNELVDAIGSSRLAKYFYMYNFIIPWMQSISYL